MIVEEIRDAKLAMKLRPPLSIICSTPETVNSAQKCVDIFNQSECFQHGEKEGKCAGDKAIARSARCTYCHNVVYAFCQLRDNHLLLLHNNNLTRLSSSPLGTDLRSSLASPRSENDVTGIIFYIHWLRARFIYILQHR